MIIKIQNTKNIYSYLEPKPNILFERNIQEDKERDKKEKNEKEIIKLISTIFDLKFLIYLNDIQHFKI